MLLLHVIFHYKKPSSSNVRLKFCSKKCHNKEFDTVHILHGILLAVANVRGYDTFCVVRSTEILLLWISKIER